MAVEIGAIQAKNHQEPPEAERRKQAFSLKPFEELCVDYHLDFRCMASRDVRE